MAGRPTGVGRVVLLGHGIAYSASPAMHAAAFAACGLDWTYELLDVAPERLAEAIAGLRRPPFAGANVTTPHKVAALAAVDAADADARAAGAVNTIVTRDGRLTGSNTDVAAIRGVLRRLGVPPGAGPALVLGAGGSARAAAVALAPAEVTFVARRPDAARGLGGRVAGWTGPDWAGLARAAAVVINTIPLGRGGEDPLPAGALPSAGVVIDLVYVAGGTPLVNRALAAGLPAAGGWEILLAQGAASFSLWTGLEAPLETMRAALERAAGASPAAEPRR